MSLGIAFPCWRGVVLQHQEKKICDATQYCTSNVGSIERYCRNQFTVKTHSTHRCSLYAKSPFESYILHVVHYPCKVPLQLPFKCYLWYGVYYPRNVPSQLLFERYVWHGDYCPHKVSSQLPFGNTSGMISLSTQSIFATSVQTIPQEQYRLSS